MWMAPEALTGSVTESQAAALDVYRYSLLSTLSSLALFTHPKYGFFQPVTCITSVSLQLRRGHMGVPASRAATRL
jgi:hypothetical protein